MKKNCRTCRNYKSGVCHSDQFVKEQDNKLPEVYIKINSEDVINDFITSSLITLDKEVIEEIVDLAHFHSEYEYEKNAYKSDTKPIIVNPSEFYCSDYR